MTRTDAKRIVLEAETGQRFAFASASSDRIDAAFAAMMAVKHAAVPVAHYDDFAVGAAAVVSATSKNTTAGSTLGAAERTDEALSVIDDTDGQAAARAICMQLQPGFRANIANEAGVAVMMRFRALMAQKGAPLPIDNAAAERVAVVMWASMRSGQA